MNSKSFRRTFVLFHITLGVVVFLQSVSTVLRASSGHFVEAMKSHVTILAVVEGLAAIIFLFPRTVKVGGAMLLSVFAVALAVHGVRGELTLFVYAVGVVLVMIEGGSYKM